MATLISSTSTTTNSSSICDSQTSLQHQQPSFSAFIPSVPLRPDEVKIENDIITSLSNSSPSNLTTLTNISHNKKMITEEKGDTVSGSESSNSEDQGHDSQSHISAHYQGQHQEDIQTAHHYTPSAAHDMTDRNGPATLVQYTGAQDGSPFFVPSTLTVMANSQHHNHHSNHGGTGGGSNAQLEDNSRKREMRLMKNREAARECRRKKKEYIKCLENRVAVLENQNKALIEELKSLKELYTGKQQVRKVEQH